MKIFHLYDFIATINSSYILSFLLQEKVV